MKIKNIKITNFRSAKDFSLDLNQDLNVFVGVNGAGKTSILEAITLSLSWLINRIIRANTSGFSIVDSDINYESSSASIKITCEENNIEYSWEIIKFGKGTLVDKKSDLSEVSQMAISFQQMIEKKQQLPIVAFYPVSRVVNKITPEVKSNSGISIIDAFDKALDGKQNFQSFFEWFRQQDDIINENTTNRSKWIQQNKKQIQLKVSKLLKQIEGSIIPGFDKDEFVFFSEQLKKDRFLYEEPRFLFHEFSRIIRMTNSKAKYEHVFHDLEFMFHKMEIFSREGKDNLIRFDGDYANILRNLIENINHSYEKESLSDNKYISIIIELFIFANELSLWWLNTNAKKNIEKAIRDSLNKTLNKKNSSKLISDQIYTSISSIVKDEYNKRNKTEENDGRELHFVKRAIEQFLPDYTNLRVKRIPRPHMLINKGETEFNLNQLSDGEKNILTLVGDIARRLSIANPKSKNPLTGEGVILIDEIDLHLHPKWQQLIIPQLRSVFPNCQLIVTTHSPQILSQIQPCNLILLENKNNNLKYSFATESYGKNTDRILEDLLGVDARPTEIKKEINKLYQFIESGKIEEAKKKYKELSAKIIGGDPELVRANVLIKRKEIIGK